jgi:hypothetical protein
MTLYEATSLLLGIFNSALAIIVLRRVKGLELLVANVVRTQVESARKRNTEDLTTRLDQLQSMRFSPLGRIPASKE